MGVWTAPTVATVINVMLSARFHRYDVVLLVFPVMATPVLILDLHEFLTEPKGYPIGWDGGGWAYQSEANYLTNVILQLSVTTASVAGYMIPPHRIVRVAARFLCGLINVGLVVPFFTRSPVRARRHCNLLGPDLII